MKQLPPPKKKGGGKGTGSGYIIDGVSTTEMSREQLEVFAHRLREEVEREREERNFFQLERDKLRTFWEISRQELEEVKAQLRNKDKSIQDDEERHLREIKVIKQRVKNLLYEHQNALAEMKVENMIALKMTQEEFNASKDVMMEDKSKLKTQLRELQDGRINEIQALKTKHSEEVTNIRKNFEIESRELERKYKERVEKIRKELIVKYKLEVLEADQRKRTEINDLISQHNRVIDNIRFYYNDLTLNNFALINNLKKELDKMRRHPAIMGREFKEKTGDVRERQLKQSLTKAEEQIAELRKIADSYQREKMYLANTKASLQLCQRDLKDLKWQNFLLEAESQKLQGERDELHKRFSESVLELQQTSSLRHISLQNKIESLGELLEQKDSQLTDILKNAVDPASLGDLKQKLEKDKDLLDRKNAAIHDLQFEVARLCKSHDDLLDTYESKLQQYGIPKEELGFTPMRASGKPKTQTRRGPAGLVTANP